MRLFAVTKRSSRLKSPNASKRRPPKEFKVRAQGPATDMIAEATIVRPVLAKLQRRGLRVHTTE